MDEGGSVKVAEVKVDVEDHILLICPFIDIIMAQRVLLTTSVVRPSFVL